MDPRSSVREHQEAALPAAYASWALPGNVIEGRCSRCQGAGRDPKKRTRSCPVCGGRGSQEYCGVCGETMRCGGRDPDGMDGFMGDPPRCQREGRSDRRTFEEINAAAPEEG